MTTMTLNIEDTNTEFIDALKKLASNFKGVSYQIETIETKEEVLKSFKEVLKEVKSGKGIKTAKSIEDFFKEQKND